MTDEFVILLDDPVTDSVEADHKVSDEFVILLDQGEAGSDDTIVLGARETIESAQALKEKLLSRLDAGAPVEINAASVETIDTACLQILVAASSDFENSGLGFFLTSASEGFVAHTQLAGLKSL